jgi:DNA-binding YbaB/EbfC family protein
MQEVLAAKQAEIEEMEFTASSGGGMVEATVNGKKQLLALSIKPEIVDPDDVEMLQDVIIAAVNEAMNYADETGSAELGKYNGFLFHGGIPGLF